MTQECFHYLKANNCSTVATDLQPCENLALMLTNKTIQLATKGLPWDTYNTIASLRVAKIRNATRNFEAQGWMVLSIKILSG